MLWTAAVALASQSEIPLPLGTPFARTSANAPGAWVGVPRVVGGAGLGIHPLAGSPQLWEGTAKGDVTLLGAGERVALGGSLTQQTSADGGNDIHFRLTRLYYDADLGADWRLGEHHGVSLRYRHRCSHGADDVDGRILIRSGPALGWEGAWGSVTQVRATATLETVLIGQNADLRFQPRGLLGGAVSVSRPVRGDLSLVGTAGLGALLVGSGTDDLWGMASPYEHLFVVPLPSGGVGVGNGRGRVLVHGERLADTGLGDEAVPVTVWSLRFGFGDA